MSSDDRDWATTKALLQHFEDEWSAGNSPNPDEYLARVPEQNRIAFLAAVVQLREEGVPLRTGFSHHALWLLTRVIGGSAIIPVLVFCALLLFAPHLWAALMAAGFILVTGQIFTRIVLSMPASRKQFCWSIATGFGLLSFLWLIFRLNG